MLALLLSSFAVRAIGAAVPAQTQVGVSVNASLSPAAGTSGFGCNDPRNATSARIRVGQSLSVRVHGDAGLSGIVMLGIGPSIGFCPGLVVPGVHNGLQTLPPNIVVQFDTSLLVTTPQGCGANGSTVVAPVAALPPLPVGVC